MSRLTELRERLAALREKVAIIRDWIRVGDFDTDTAEIIGDELLAYRDREAELVREIAELEGGDEGSAGVREPRRPRPLPMQGASAVPIPTDGVIVVSGLASPGRGRTTCRHVLNSAELRTQRGKVGWFTGRSPS